MCGINGLVFAKKEEIELMNMTLGHRGPDGEGVFINKDIGLGSRRLSIIDLSKNGDQPIYSRDRRYVIVYNGEIYNYQAIRRLIGKYPFKGNSDTEVVLAGYLKWGERILEKLNGIFAFSIYDTRKKVLFCARDRFGIKPFYYLLKPRFAFSSEIKPLLNITSPVLDSQSLDEFITYEHNFSGNTLFCKIKELRPGCTLRYDLNSKKMFQKRYWRLDYKVDKKRNFIEWQKVVYQSVIKSVKLQLVSDVEIGTYLSGGIDSSIITAIAAECLPYRVHNFSLVFNGKESEEKFIRMLVKKYPRLKSHIICLNVEQYWKEFVGCTLSNEYPLVFPDHVAQYVLAKEASKYVKVVLSGEGSDEIFGGYSRHLFATNSNGSYFGTFSFVIFKIFQVAAMMLKLPPNLFSSKFLSPAVTQAMTINYFDQFRKAKIYGIKMRSRSKNIRDYLIKVNNETGDYFSRISYVEINTYLRTILNKQDKLNMAYGVECRVPYLDHELVGRCLNIPQKYKVNINKGKIILKKAFEYMVPREIVTRKKAGFPVPIKEYLVKIQWGSGVLEESELAKDGYLNRTYLYKIRSNQDVKATYFMLALEVWYRLFIKQISQREIYMDLIGKNKQKTYY